MLHNRYLMISFMGESRKRNLIRIAILDRDGILACGSPQEIRACEDPAVRRFLGGKYEQREVDGAAYLASFE